MISESWHARGWSTPPEGTPTCHPTLRTQSLPEPCGQSSPLPPDTSRKAANLLMGPDPLGADVLRAGAAAGPTAAGAVVAGRPAAASCSPAPSARHRSQHQVQKHTRWIFSCQVLSAAQRRCER